MSVTYNSQELRNRLMLAAREVAGELTGTFFETVDRLAPVENGHLHQTLGTALSMSGAENTEDVASGMLAKGSGDQTATSLAFGILVSLLMEGELLADVALHSGRLFEVGA